MPYPLENYIKCILQVVSLSQANWYPNIGLPSHRAITISHKYKPMRILWRFMEIFSPGRVSVCDYNATEWILDWMRWFYDAIKMQGVYSVKKCKPKLKKLQQHGKERVCAQLKWNKVNPNSDKAWVTHQNYNFMFGYTRKQLEV